MHRSEFNFFFQRGVAGIWPELKDHYASGCPHAQLGPAGLNPMSLRLL